MAVRRKGRCLFRHSGREFVWWDDNDTYIRIASADKSLVVAYLLYGAPLDMSGLVAVHGPAFPGLERAEKRPVYLVVPQSVVDEFLHSMGALVNALLTWCLDPEHEIVRYEGNVQLPY